MNMTLEEQAAYKRILSLVDEGSFVEIGREVTARSTDFSMEIKKEPTDGVVTGYGVIDGNLVYIFSQSPSVLGGSIGEMHAKKIVHLYEMAMKVGAPVVGLLDSTGMRLEEGADALEAFGAIYQQQSLASGVIPQIMAVFGNCGGAMAVLASLADFCFIENEGRIFINSPDAIAGNRKEALDTSCATFQARENGYIDQRGQMQEIMAGIRELICLLPANNEDNDSFEECLDDLNRLCHHIESVKDDPRMYLPMLSDEGLFFETRQEFAKEMVTGFIRLNGMTVGAVAPGTKQYDDNGEVICQFDFGLSARGFRKAADFVLFCDAFALPIVTLIQGEGLKATLCGEKNMAREASRLVHAYANATVPKINVLTGKVYGSLYSMLNCKSLGADMVYAWPEAEVAPMDSRLAAQILCKSQSLEELKEKEKEYKEKQGSLKAVAQRGYVDAIISPEQTRKYLIGACEMLFTKREDRPVRKHGTV